jgi:hypothetical protein
MRVGIVVTASGTLQFHTDGTSQTIQFTITPPITSATSEGGGTAVGQTGFGDGMIQAGLRYVFGGITFSSKLSQQSSEYVSVDWTITYLVA